MAGCWKVIQGFLSHQFSWPVHSEDKWKDGKCSPKNNSGNFLITPLIKGGYPPGFIVFWAPTLQTSAEKPPPGFFSFCSSWLEPKAVRHLSLTSRLSEGRLIGRQDVDLLLTNVALKGRRKIDSPAALLPGARPWHRATKLQAEKCTSLRMKVLSPPPSHPFKKVSGQMIFSSTPFKLQNRQFLHFWLVTWFLQRTGESVIA